jgi:hypothetical protein
VALRNIFLKIRKDGICYIEKQSMLQWETMHVTKTNGACFKEKHRMLQRNIPRIERFDNFHYPNAECLSRRIKAHFA